MAKKPTSPLKVTAHLTDGRLNSSDGLVMLDGIIYHAWFCVHAPQVLEGKGDTEYDGYIGLPLRNNPGNVWSASRAVYTEVAQEIAHYSKHPNFFDADKMSKLDMDKGLISSSIGAYRAYRMPQIIRTVKDGLLTFWCMGDAEKINMFLSKMVAAGKKAAMGYGFIDRWEVKDAEDDYSFWHPEYGLMRPIPVESDIAKGHDMTGYPVFQYRITPPYWKEVKRMLCYVPIGGGV